MSEDMNKNLELIHDRFRATGDKTEYTEQLHAHWRQYGQWELPEYNNESISHD